MVRLPDPKRTHIWLGLILTAYLLLGIAYMAQIPLFEAPDESSHLMVIDYVRRHRTLQPYVLPARRADSAENMAWFLEYHDPPLYYAPPLYYTLTALTTAWTDFDDLPQLLVPSPAWEAGWAPQQNSILENKNMYAHRFDEETLLRSDTTRATWFLRLLGLGFGGVVITCTHRLARHLWWDKPALAHGAAALVAFIPQFITTSASVSHNTLFNALFALFLLSLVRIINGKPDWRHWMLLGGLTGAALLTKQTALLMFPPTALGLWLHARQQQRTWLLILYQGIAFITPALLLGGWWYVRSTLQHGDPLGMAMHAAIQVPLDHLGALEAWKILRTFWAAFGWSLLLLPKWVYVIVWAVIGTGMAGVLKAIVSSDIQQRIVPSLGLLTTTLALNVGSLLRWATQTGAPDGRLLYPSLPALAVLTTWGITRWLPDQRRQRWALGLMGASALICTALVPGLVLKPAFGSPRVTGPLPSEAKRLQADFGEITLIGYQAPDGNLHPGGNLAVTTYWHADSPPSQPYHVWAQLGPQDPTNYVSGEDTWLGGTLYPSDLWTADDVIRQQHTFMLPENVSAPALLWVRAGLTDESGTRLTRTDAESNLTTFGPWRVLHNEPLPPPRHESRATLGPAALLGYDLTSPNASGVVTLTLHWRADEKSATDYNVFVHLLDENGEILDQDDGTPRNGAYPTSWWMPGQIVLDPHVLTLPAETSAAQISVGLYDPETGERVAASDEKGNRYLNDAVPLQTIRW
jgi:4-amino-4-deoxy-L-arabinose transferase-like glycosyltransferase